MKLTDLNDDVVLLINKLIQPEDFDAWLATSKRIYTIAHKRLPRHKALKARYGHLIMKDEHLAHLLLDIGQDALIASYIKTLDYCSHEEWDPEDSEPCQKTNDEGEDGEDHDDEEQLTECGYALFEELPVTFQYLPLFQEEEINLQDETQALAFILLLLPNLSTLKLRQPSWRADELREVVRHIRKWPASQQANRPHSHGFWPLNRLQTIEMDMRMSENQNLLPFVIFNDLPHLRTLRGCDVETVDWGDEEWIFDDFDFETSHVEVLEFSQSNIRHPTLQENAFSEILKCMPKLKSFKYSARRDEPGRFGANVVIECLLSEPCHVGLEHLSLTGPIPTSEVAPSLRSMCRLKVLEIDADALLDFLEFSLSSAYATSSKFRPSGRDFHRPLVETQDEIQTPHRRLRTIPYLSDWLPLSIEHLILNLRRLDSADVEILFCGLRDSSLGPQLPKLRKLSYIGADLNADLMYELVEQLNIEIEALEKWVPEHDKRWI